VNADELIEHVERVAKIERDGRRHAATRQECREELVALAPALAAWARTAYEALVEAEWNGSQWIGQQTCPECGGEQRLGHSDDCGVRAALFFRDDSEPITI
jgi:hypothetical protein